MQMPLGAPPPPSHAENPDGNARDQPTVKPNIDVSDFSSRPGAKRKMPLDVLPPQSETKRYKRLNSGDRGDQPTE